MGRAAHSVEAKAVVRIEVAVRPRPCLVVGSNGFDGLNDEGDSDYFDY
jgi:hypothetical protein